MVINVLPRRHPSMPYTSPGTCFYKVKLSLFDFNSAVKTCFCCRCTCQVCQLEVSRVAVKLLPCHLAKWVEICSFQQHWDHLKLSTCSLGKKFFIFNEIQSQSKFLNTKLPNSYKCYSTVTSKVLLN